MNVRIHSVQFNVDDSANPAGWKHIASGQWEPETFRLLDHFLKKEDVVLDIGCWEGALALYAAHLSKKVHAIDPDPKAFVQLKKNISLNADVAPKIMAHNIAIWKEKKALPLYARNDFGDSASSLMLRVRDNKDFIPVNCISPAAFLSENGISHIDFIKMDIEGAEFELLPAMIETLKQHGKPSLYISFHYNYLREKIYSEKVGNRLLSKLLMKAEGAFHLNFFRKKINKAIRKSLMNYSFYNYVYTASGEQISLKDILERPQLLQKKNAVLFTDEKW